MSINEFESIKKKIIATNIEIEIILDNLNQYSPKDRLKILKNYKKKLVNDDMSECVRNFFYSKVKDS